MQPEPRRIHVVVGTPTFTNAQATEFTGSMIELAGEMSRRSISLGWAVWPNLQFVDAARNFIVRDFLAKNPTATHLFFIDDDVGFPWMKVLEFLVLDLPIVAGVPPMKIDGPGQFPVFLTLLPNAEGRSQRDRLVRKGHLLQATQIPAGFLCIRRDVLEGMARVASTYAMMASNGAMDVCFNIFDRGPREPLTGKRSGEYVGEDTWFGQLAQAAGYEIWVDPDIEFTHRGTKKWVGNLLHHVEGYLNGVSTGAAHEMQLKLTHAPDGTIDATLTELPAGEVVQAQVDVEQPNNERAEEPTP